MRTTMSACRISILTTNVKTLAITSASGTRWRVSGACDCTGCSFSRAWLALLCSSSHVPIQHSCHIYIYIYTYIHVFTHAHTHTFTICSIFMYAPRMFARSPHSSQPQRHATRHLQKLHDKHHDPHDHHHHYYHGHAPDKPTVSPSPSSDVVAAPPPVAVAKSQKGQQKSVARFFKTLPKPKLVNFKPDAHVTFQYK